MGGASQPSPNEWLDGVLERCLSRHWRWHMAEGAGLILLGVLALLTAKSANAALSGTILLAGGAATLVAVWRAGHYPAYGLALLCALASLMAGMQLLGDPPAQVLSLIFAACFICRGALTLLVAAQHRRQAFAAWEWFAVSGVASLILAWLILCGLPGPYVWMLGLLLGVALIFDGCALLAHVAAASTQGAAAPAPMLEERHAPVMQHAPVYEDGLPV